jgi:tRNA(fMet)-specific endonuclease VapC
MRFREGVDVRTALLDTDTLSLFFRKSSTIVEHFEEYLKFFETVSFSIITYYEILSGLRHRDALRQIKSFQEFANMNTIVPLTERSVEISAGLYADLRKIGKPLDDVDLLIAGIALEGDMTLVTCNEKHFDRISGLHIENWNS